MTMAVRPLMTTSSPSWICASVNGSTLAVASSRMTIAGSCSSTRASATSCRWPIDSRALSPTCGLQTLRQRINQSPSPICGAALLDLSSLASGRA